jgi:hypothetical protein
MYVLYRRKSLLIKTTQPHLHLTKDLQSFQFSTIYLKKTKHAKLCTMSACLQTTVMINNKRCSSITKRPFTTYLDDQFNILKFIINILVIQFPFTGNINGLSGDFAAVSLIVVTISYRLFEEVMYQNFVGFFVLRKKSKMNKIKRPRAVIVANQNMILSLVFETPCNSPN